MRKRKDLRPYQDAATVFVKEKKRCALFIDPGLGKTAITTTAFSELIDDMECGMTLIVAPPRVAKKTWPDEFKAWAHTADKSFVHITGSIAKRRKLMKRRACFHIISIEMLPWLLAELGGHAPDMRRIKALLQGPNMPPDTRPEAALKLRVEGLLANGVPKEKLRDEMSAEDVEEVAARAAKEENKWLPPVKKMPYTAMVIDESSKVKSHSTNRYRALKLMAFRVEYFVILTGTPSPNSLQDLWSQIYLIDQGRRLGANITAFRDRWCRQSYDGHGFTVKDFAVSIIEEKISDICFTLREEDYADLPPRLYNNVLLQFTDAQMKQYRQFESTLILKATEDKNIIASGGAAITNKLMQLANGVVYDEEKNEHAFHTIKLDALQDIVDEVQGKPVLVAYQYKSDLKRILAKFPNARRFDDSDATQDAWNRGEIPMLLVHPQSAAHGLNLQFGGSVVVWYGLTWSLELYIQLNKRLHRSGQIETVVIHHLIIEGTMDADALKALDGKHNTQEALLNALKKRIKLYEKN